MIIYIIGHKVIISCEAHFYTKLILIIFLIVVVIWSYCSCFCCCCCSSSGMNNGVLLLRIMKWILSITISLNHIIPRVSENKLEGKYIVYCVCIAVGRKKKEHRLLTTPGITCRGVRVKWLFYSQEHLYNQSLPSFTLMLSEI